MIVNYFGPASKTTSLLKKQKSNVWQTKILQLLDELVAQKEILRPKSKSKWGLDGIRGEV